MIGHHARFRENDDLPLWRGPATKKKPPFFNARALITRKNYAQQGCAMQYWGITSNSTESFNIIKTRVIDKTNFLTWADLLHAVPREFKNNIMPLISSPSCVINNNVFDITKKKSKH